MRGGVFGRWLGHDDGALIKGINSLIKETPEGSLVPSTMRGHREKAVYEPGSRPSPNPESADTLILNFSVFRTMRDKRMSFISHLVYGTLL